MREEDFITIGRVQRIHGFKGKLEISYTDDVFLRANTSWLFFRMDGLPVPFDVVECAVRGNGRALIQLENVDGSEAAQKFLDSEILFLKSEIVEREEDPDSWNFLLGFSVEDIHAGVVGKVTDVDDQSANVILFVTQEDGKEVLIPMHPDFVKHCDEKERLISMELPDGLLSLNE